MLYWGQKMHRIQSITHFACLKVVLTRMNLTQVWRIPQMETFCSTRINLTVMARYFTCSASFEWYPRQMQPWPVPWKMTVYTQEQFLECNRKRTWPHSGAGYFSRLPVGGISAFRSPPGTEENHSENHTEENTSLRQIWLFPHAWFFTEWSPEN